MNELDRAIESVVKRLVIVMAVVGFVVVFTVLGIAGGII
jgi:hypothetical protein